MNKRYEQDVPLVKKTAASFETPTCWQLVVVALLSIMLGILYYVLYRQHAIPLAISGLADMPMLQAVPRPALPGWLAQSIPSLMHAFSMQLFMHVLLQRSSMSPVRARGTLLLALLSFECMAGYFDLNDIIAIVVGVILAELVVRTARPGRHHLISVRCWAQRLLIVAAGFSAAASYVLSDYAECARFENGICVEYKKAAVPVYLSYRDLRQAVRVESARPPDNLGRIYIYGDYLFLNEVNQGLHIVDNRNPESPETLAFIRIPGNTEVAIRDNYLYADSYVDLITLDLNDPLNIQLIGRQQDIFPYDAFQNIPYNISFRQSAIDASLGVVAGYRLAGD